MGSQSLVERQPHAVCVPYPAQGHITPMLRLAKILHHKGFHITFVNTDFNHQRLLRSRGPNSLDGLPSFRFRTISDGLPPSDPDATQDIPALCDSTSKHCLAPFRELLTKINVDAAESGGPPVTVIVSDVIMSFTLDAAEELGVPEFLLWTASASSFLGYMHYRHLIEKRLTPFKDDSYFTNGYLDTIIDWIPGMKSPRLKDLPTFIRTTNPDDIMIKFVLRETHRATRAAGIIVNTFHELERDSLESLSTILPPIYSIGPLQFFTNQIQESGLKNIGSNLWREEAECLKWLDSKEPNSVVYVNFGSIVVMTPSQLVEFAWGLANSNREFLWVIRPDLVCGDTAVLPAEFLEVTKNRGLMASWCPQDQVLQHQAVGGFLTHNGWNSTVESIVGGVPMICWPFFADQQTNCWRCCTEWGIGMEIDSDVKRNEVEKLVRELMEGEKGKEMKRNALMWKQKSEDSTTLDGSSCLNLQKLIEQVLLCSEN
uniref:7-deoxyloganetin glucosyltransferase n=1 Tax=Eucommia ulmoides TaxID=4392 RepID=A0AAU7YSK0_EUCUL